MAFPHTAPSHTHLTPPPRQVDYRPGSPSDYSHFQELPLKGRAKGKGKGVAKGTDPASREPLNFRILALPVSNGDSVDAETDRQQQPQPGGAPGRVSPGQTGQTYSRRGGARRTFDLDNAMMAFSQFWSNMRRGTRTGSDGGSSVATSEVAQHHHHQPPGQQEAGSVSPRLLLAGGSPGQVRGPARTESIFEELDLGQREAPSPSPDRLREMSGGGG